MSDASQSIALVTGATSGIGEVTARELVRKGYHVVLLARNAEKAAHTRQQLQQLAQPGTRVDVLLCDLSDLGQVRRAAEEFNQRYARLDVLINNAGLVFGAERETSVNGHEMTLATNHLGPFLLTSLLLDKLQRSPAARIINVASMAHKFARPDLADLNATRNYSPMRAYANSKLFNILFTQELARQLRQRGITNVSTNSLHPGVVASNFGSNSTWLTRAFYQMAAPFMTTSEDGAQTSIYLATSPEVAGTSGGYFAKKRPEPVKSTFNIPENIRHFWQKSEEMIGQPFFQD
ncbi:SDR family NAD(P)-dependent oxidoreductase [Microvirga sp. STR05]|uniref:SDR family NAD(P)-dependent oxidoreductase n=1 Tax=Hymenobacter duratus TaxID=2771356 RepID=A0ABR8JCG4_9BACT|nr:SDR family NAD(P)-dependent oxidoreductase [Hymenobacter duratus]MBD2714398.1 SDR family NAD(P)-dependent oxidoreductase [Hymenobacter duratus]MBR7949301.1 SDR family NAD(P)-dependent oxidoreductase [Microvirga sp. STR05]